MATGSAASWPERISPSTSILLVHGADDDRVAVDNMLTMAQHFARLERLFEVMIPEDGSHTLIEHWKRVRTAMDRWFDLHLRND
ncbi:alpha/beta hydrolase family protein [Erythrobacter rubeus]|uniref:Prolyl oligopeptidase family serine peptidase n=1 Tax=Erythrobacter rubeus TaxID=2760803 RepID=A0ABR8KNL0_9SPHN|nr:prolyl oligopeptidase family serine peptidase [Erythrobacter rubeus]MBD2840960.1 prolyl oligopeptidase family serine peptidase [Erythrobacter rubeus]